MWRRRQRGGWAVALKDGAMTMVALTTAGVGGCGGAGGRGGGGGGSGGCGCGRVTAATDAVCGRQRGSGDSLVCDDGERRRRKRGNNRVVYFDEAD